MPQSLDLAPVRPRGYPARAPAVLGQDLTAVFGVAVGVVLFHKQKTDSLRIEMRVFSALTIAALGGGLLLASNKIGSNGKEDLAMEGFKKPAESKLKERLTPLQFEVTQENGTEPPFYNTFWDNKEQGIYVDVVSGEPLFSSLDKFDSGTGWPSFTRPLEPGNIVERDDYRLGMKRVEVRSKHGDSHLGHLFDDGPLPTRLRYCINSASLRFIPVNKLEKEGYGKYSALFGNGAGGSKDSASKVTHSPAAETAIVAGGCFWGVEELMRKLPGVLDTEVGYTGGHVDDPTYEDVKPGSSGHAEAVRVTFDPQVLSYEDLLKYFFRLHDPTTKNRQGNDIGTQYRSAIFYLDEKQKKIAEQVKNWVDKSGKWSSEVVTEIVPASPFYRAEEYHQDYLQKHPGGYTCHYLRD